MLDTGCWKTSDQLTVIGYQENHRIKQEEGPPGAPSAYAYAIKLRRDKTARQGSQRNDKAEELLNQFVKDLHTKAIMPQIQVFQCASLQFLRCESSGVHHFTQVPQALRGN